MAAGMGAALCLLYDLFRILRLVFSSGKAVAFAEDVLWFSVAAIATYMLCLARCNGEVRSYIIIGEIIGFIICRLTASRGLMLAAKPTVRMAKRLLKRLHGGIMHLFAPLKGKVIEKFNEIKSKKSKKQKKHLHLRIPLLYNRKKEKILSDFDTE